MFTASEIIELSKSGFSKDDIMELAKLSEMKSEPPKADPEPPKAEPEPKPETKTEPNIDTNAILQKLAQSITGSTASIDVPPTVKIDDVLGKHLSTLIVGEERTN